MSDIPSIMTFDSNVADAQAPDPLPAGEYKAVVQSSTIKESKSKPGNYYIELMVRVAPEDFPADFDPENAPDGVVLPYRRVQYQQSKRGMYSVRKLCEALNAPMSNQIDPQDFVQRECKIKTENKADLEGLPRSEVVSINRL